MVFAFAGFPLFFLLFALLEVLFEPFYFLSELIRDCLRLIFVRDDMGGEKDNQFSPLICALILSEQKTEKRDFTQERD